MQIKTVRHYFSLIERIDTIYNFGIIIDKIIFSFNANGNTNC